MPSKRKGRKGGSHGRPPHLNDRVTRTLTRTMAAQVPGARYWREQHAVKVTYLLFCEALLQERGQYRGALPGDDTSRVRRRVYPCRYGDHHLIENGQVHWHIGRARRV